MPAATAPKAETLPKFSVAVLVPAPDESATPAASLLKTRLMDELTVAFTVNVPVAVWAASIAGTMSIATIVVRTSFFIVFPLLLVTFISRIIFFLNSIGRGREIDGCSYRKSDRRSACPRSSHGDHQPQIVSDISVICASRRNRLGRSGQRHCVDLVRHSRSGSSRQIGSECVIGAGQPAFDHVHVKHRLHRISYGAHCWPSHARRQGAKSRNDSEAGARSGSTAVSKGHTPGRSIENQSQSALVDQSGVDRAIRSLSVEPGAAEKECLQSGSQNRVVSVAHLLTLLIRCGLH